MTDEKDVRSSLREAILYLKEKQVDEAEMMAVHRQAYRDRLPGKLFERFIRIPWDISMGMPEKHPWEE